MSKATVNNNAPHGLSRSIFDAVNSWMARPEQVVQIIIKPPPNVADRGTLRKLFDDEYVPGLFWICERVASADFLWDENIRDYGEWVRHVARAALQSLTARSGSPGPFTRLNHQTIEFLADSVLGTLELPCQGRTLAACHTNQQADALIWRIIKLFLFGDPDTDLPTQQEFNGLARAIISPILNCLADRSIDELWRIAIDAGLIGVDLKESFLGTQITGPGSMSRAIPLKVGSRIASAHEVLDELVRRSTEPLGIDFRREYDAEVLAAPGPRSVAWLTDDYIETAFDLKLIEAQMQMKPDLFFTVIARDGSHRQDASYEDVMTLLTGEMSFASLRELHKSGRLHVCPAGPRTSSIDGGMLSQEAADHLAAAHVVVIKGARSYEMLQGLKKPAYYCLSGNHSFTESLTGLDMSLAQGILLRQDPGVLTYADFKARATRRAYAKSGREYGLARMTASEYAAARRSANYREHLRRFSNQVDECNAWLLAQADQLGRTFSEVTFSGGSATGET